MQLSTLQPHNPQLCDYIRYLEAQPPSADLQTMLGIAYVAQGDVCRAVAALESAIALDANHFFAHLRYGDLLFRISSLEAARTISERALLLARGVGQWRMARQQLSRIRDCSEAVTTSLDAIVWNPAWTFLFALALLATFCPHLL